MLNRERAIVLHHARRRTAATLLAITDMRVIQREKWTASGVRTRNVISFFNRHL